MFLLSAVRDRVCICVFSKLTYTQLLQEYYLSRRGDVSALKHQKLRCEEHF